MRAGFATAPAGGYKAAWHRFDNAAGTATAIGETTSTTESLQAPAGLPSADGTFIKVSVSGVDPAHPAWARAVDVYFKRTATGWTLVGLERLA